MEGKKRKKGKGSKARPQDGRRRWWLVTGRDSRWGLEPQPEPRSTWRGPCQPVSGGNSAPNCEHARAKSYTHLSALLGTLAA